MSNGPKPHFGWKFCSLTQQLVSMSHSTSTSEHSGCCASSGTGSSKFSIRKVCPCLSSIFLTNYLGHDSSTESNSLYDQYHLASGNTPMSINIIWLYIMNMITLDNYNSMFRYTLQQLIHSYNLDIWFDK